MKKTLLFVLLGAAAGVAGYQIYKKKTERAKDIYAQEASEHQYGLYISKPVKAKDAEPDAAGERSFEGPEAATNTKTCETLEEGPATESKTAPETAEEAPAEPAVETAEAEAVIDAAIDTAAEEKKTKKARKAEPKKN